MFSAIPDTTSPQAPRRPRILAQFSFTVFTLLAGAAALAQAEKRPEDARKYLNEVINSKAPQAGAARAQLKALTL